jgi:transcriptional regulator with XRE-family HTH domain
MRVNAFEPVTVPTGAWRREQTQALLRSRDIAGLLRFVQQHTGASQSRLAAAIGMVQGRVSEIMRGSRMVTTLDVFERIADGIAMPDDARILLGLAPKNPAGLDHLGPSGRAEVIAAYPSQSAAKADMKAAAKDVREIDILAVRGLGIIGLNDSLLRASVTANRPAVQVLLLDPDGEAAVRRAVEIGESVESFTSGLRLAIARLRELTEQTGGAVQGYLYDLLPTWRVIRLDNTMFVSAFGSEHEGHTSPMYRITETRSGALYRGYRRFIEELRLTAKHVL